VHDGFGRALTIGVEEELFLVDAETFDTTPAFSRLFPNHGERVKPELFECFVEITTPVCESAGDVLDELRRLRAEVAGRGRSQHVTLLASGTHPRARAAGQPIIAKPRYRTMKAELGDAVYRQLVCGLHVHIGMRTADECLRALEGVRPWLARLLAYSANSPFVEGEDSGADSARWSRLAELPRGGPPPPLATWEDWERATAGVDYTRLWWHARPHPRHGTLEIRVMDQQTDVRRSAGFAALVQALVAAVLERRPHPADDADLTSVVEEHARTMNGWPLVEPLLSEPPEAERQRRIARSMGLDGLVLDLAGRTLE
jgi:glutamate---cysteine ligase / carboxylate-amine ligase